MGSNMNTGSAPKVSSAAEVVDRVGGMFAQVVTVSMAVIAILGGLRLEGILRQVELREANGFALVNPQGLLFEGVDVLFAHPSVTIMFFAMLLLVLSPVTSSGKSGFRLEFVAYPRVSRIGLTLLVLTSILVSLPWIGTLVVVLSWLVLWRLRRRMTLGGAWRSSVIAGVCVVCVGFATVYVDAPAPPEVKITLVRATTGQSGVAVTDGYSEPEVIKGQLFSQGNNNSWLVVNDGKIEVVPSTLIRRLKITQSDTKGDGSGAGDHRLLIQRIF